MMKKTIILLLILFFAIPTIFAQGGNPFDPDMQKCIAESVVRIQITKNDNSVFQGSGVVVSKDGIIFTNAHVIEEAFEIQVWVFDEEDKPPVFSYYAEIEQIEDDLDFAVIKITKDNEGNTVNPEFECILPWNTNPLSRYSDVYIVGFPEIAGGVQSSTAGIISASQKINMVDRGQVTFYETDATFSVGASGGAVINANGEYVGIPTYWRTDPSAAQTAYLMPLATLCDLESDICEYQSSSPETSLQGITVAEIESLMRQNQDTSELIQALNNYWENDPDKGGDWGENRIIISGPAIFWTNLFTNVDSLPTGISKVNVEGGWGVYQIAYGFEYSIPEPNEGGRYLRIVDTANPQTTCFVESYSFTGTPAGPTVTLGTHVSLQGVAQGVANCGKSRIYVNGQIIVDIGPEPFVIWKTENFGTGTYNICLALTIDDSWGDFPLICLDYNVINP